MERARTRSRVASLGRLACTLAVVLPGCAIQVPPIPLTLDTPRAGVERAIEPVPAILRVDTFEDRRPAVEREGRIPRGWYFLVYNSRKGTYVTGDADFTEPVPAAAADAVAHVLDASGNFRAVERAEPSAGDAKLATRDGTPVYRLRGEILHLFGSQEQRAFYVITTVFWMFVNDVSPPTGHIELVFALSKGTSSQCLWSQTLTETWSDPAYMRNQNAAVALARVADRLAQSLADAIRGGPAPPALEARAERGPVR